MLRESVWQTPQVRIFTSVRARGGGEEGAGTGFVTGFGAGTGFGEGTGFGAEAGFGAGSGE